MSIEIRVELFENNNGSKGAAIPGQNLLVGQEAIAEISVGEFGIDPVGLTALGLDLALPGELRLISDLVPNVIVAPDVEPTTLNLGGNFARIDAIAAPDTAIGSGEFVPFAQIGIEAIAPNFLAEPIAIELSDFGLQLADGSTEENIATTLLSPRIDVSPLLEIQVQYFESNDGSKGDLISSLVPGQEFIAEISVKDGREKVAIADLGLTALGLDLAFDPDVLTLLSPLTEDNLLDADTAIVAPGFDFFVGGSLDAEAGTITGLSASVLTLEEDSENNPPIGNEDEFVPFAELEFQAIAPRSGFAPLDLGVNETQGFSLFDGTSSPDGTGAEIFDPGIPIAPPVEIELALFADDNGTPGDRIASVNPGDRFFAEILVRDNRVNLPEGATGLTALGLDLDFDPEVLSLLAPLNGDGELIPEDVITAESFTSFIGGTFDAETGAIDNLSGSSLILDGDDGAPIGVGDFDSFGLFQFQTDTRGSDFTAIDIAIDQTLGFSLADGTTDKDELAVGISGTAIAVAPAVEVISELFLSDTGEPIAFPEDGILAPGDRFFVEFFVRDNRTNLPENATGLTGLGLDIDFDPDAIALLSPLDEDGNLLAEDAITAESFTTFLGGEFDAETGFIEGLSGSALVPDGDNGEAIGAGELASFGRLEFQIQPTATNADIDVEINPTQGFALQDGSTEADVTSVVIDPFTQLAVAPPLEIEIQLFASNDGEIGDPLFGDTIAPGQEFFLEILVRDNRNLPEDAIGLTSLGLDFGFHTGCFELISALDEDGQFLPAEAIAPESFSSFVGGSFDAATGRITGLSASSLIPGETGGEAIGAGEFSTFARFQFRASDVFADNVVFDLDLNATQGFSLRDGSTDADLPVEIEFQLVDVGFVNQPPVFESEAFEFAAVNSVVASDGDVVGTVTATDPDDDALVFAIAEGNDPDGNDIPAFAINPESGEVTIANAAELTSDRFDLFVTVTDPEGLADEATVAIPILFGLTVSDATVELPENSSDVVIAIPISDPDTPLADLNVALLEGNADPDEDGTFAFGNPQFNEDEQQWELAIADPDDLNFEGEINAFELTIEASDGENSDTGVLSVLLTDVNEAPVFAQALFEFAIVTAEEASAGDVAGTVSATDPDAGDTLTFAIASGNPGDAFAIDPVTGEIAIADPAALTQSFELAVTATDTGGLEATATVAIPVDTLADDPPVVSDVTVEIPENSSDAVIAIPIGDPDTPLGDLTVAIASGNTDPDGDGTLAFAAPQFNEGQWEIAIADPDDLDFEGDTNPFALEIEASDAENTASGTLTVALTNVNEAPAFAEETFTFEAIAPGTVNNGDIVGTVLASDPDAGDTLTFAIASGNDAGAFSINSETGEIAIADVLQLTQEEFTLAVTATDLGGLQDSADAVIPVAIDNAPIVGNATFTIPENSSDAVIVIPVSDPDTPLAELAIAITEGNADPNENGIFAFSSPQFNAEAQQWEIGIADSGDLDFEGEINSFVLTVTASDGDNSNSGQLTVNLSDVNEAPVFSEAIFNFALVDAASANNGDIVGTVTATDPDLGDSLSFEIVAGNTGNALAISPISGEIAIADVAALTQSFELSVAATDTEDEQATATVVIPVDTVAADPPNVADRSVEIPENSTQAIALTITDPDTPLADLVVTLSDGNLDPDGDGTPAFADPEFIAGQWEIAIADPDDLDFEGDPNTFALTVEASDGENSDTGVVTVSLTNANDAPAFTQDSFAFAPVDLAIVSEGDIVGTVAATDPDAGDTLTFAIAAGNDAGGFAIDSVTGEIAIADLAQITADAELTVTVTDNSGLQATAPVEIPVDLNEPPVIPSNVEAPENSSQAIAIPFSDPDTPLADLVIILTGGNTDPNGNGTPAFGELPFNADTGQWELGIADPGDLDFESEPNFFTLALEVSDGLNTSTGDLIVNLTNVNEAPVFDFEVFAFEPVVAATAGNGDLVGTVTATDPDAGDSLTFAIASGNEAGAFVLNSQTGAIAIADRTQLTEDFTLAVTVTDSGSLQATATVEIPVDTDLPDPPVVEDASVEIPENSSEAIVVIPVTDADTPLADLLVTLSGGNLDIDGDGTVAFATPQFNAEEGQWEIGIADSGDLDFESETNAFVLTVEASDGTSSDTGEITVNLTDVNEAPVFAQDTFTFATLIAAEVENGAIAGQIEATDPDAGDSVTFAIASGNEGNAFVVDELTGEIAIAGATQLTQSFTLGVTATDSGDLQATATVEIPVDTLADDPPSVADASVEIPENSTQAIALTITDPDTPVADLVVTLSDGNLDPDGDGISAFADPEFNEEEQQWEIAIADPGDLDFEGETNAFVLTVTASDAESSDTGELTVNLTNVNEAPVFAQETFVFEIIEIATASNGDLVGTVDATDPDAGDSVTFAIASGNEGNAFVVDELTGEIAIADLAQLSADQSLTVTATDNSGLQAIATVTIPVTAAPQPPTVEDASVEIPENSSDEVIVVPVTDPDTPLADLAVSFIGGNLDPDGDGTFAFAAPQFNAEEGQWEIAIADPDDLNFESDSTSFNLEVNASDGDSDDSGTIAVTVTDVNEAPSFSEDSFAFPLDAIAASNGDRVGVLNATDPDAGDTDTLSFAIASGNEGGAFAIDEDGQITVADADQLTGDFSLTATVTDSEGLSDSTSVEISVETGPDFSLDVTGSGEATAFNDGLVIFRFLAGLAPATFEGALGADATRSSDEINAELIAAEDTGALDADGNGEATAFNDGLIIFRFLAGLSPVTFEGALSEGAERSVDEIAEFLEQLLPSGTVPARPAEPPLAADLLTETAIAQPAEFG